MRRTVMKSRANRASESSTARAITAPLVADLTGAGPAPRAAVKINHHVCVK